MCAHKHTSVCVCVHTNTRVCVYVHMGVRVWVCVCIHACVRLLFMLPVSQPEYSDDPVAQTE